MRKEKTRYADSTLKAWSATILSELEHHPSFRKARTVVLYHSLTDEVYTHEFIETWKEKKKILLPVVCGDCLELREYAGKAQTAQGCFGITEPLGTPFTEYDKIDLVIVPGVAFDRNKNRLGRGKGYYDKLLPLIKARKIGLCFPFQVVEQVPTEPLDIGMDDLIYGKCIP